MHYISLRAALVLIHVVLFPFTFFKNNFDILFDEIKNVIINAKLLGLFKSYLNFTSGDVARLLIFRPGVS